VHADPEGVLMSAEDWAGRHERFLPSVDDNLFIASLMHPVQKPGEYAGWIAPPRIGIDNMPGDFEYVKIAD
jgi:benzoyl-CoA 2,3-dioxygenase component B